MGGGHWQEGLPHPHPLTSYWQTPLSEIANHRSTPELPTTTDYVIVGTGITGASIATKLLSATPSAKITVVEARTVCSGATGRNGGHCGFNYGGLFNDDLQDYGLEEALRGEKFGVDNVANVVAFIRNNGIDCDLEAVDRVNLEAEEDRWRKRADGLRHRADALRKAKGEEVVESPGVKGPDFIEDIGGLKTYWGKCAQEFLKMDNVAGAVCFPGFTVHPYKLVTEMFRRLIRQGVNLQTTTPVLSLSSSPKSSATDSVLHRWTVRTPRGDIKAKHVILATNGYTSALYKPLATSKFLIPTRAQAVAIRPGSAIQNEPRIHKGIGLNGFGQQDYCMQRPAGSTGEGDLVYGGGRRISKTGEHWTLDDSVVNPEIAEYLPKAPRQFWGKENWGENGRLLMQWTGIMGYTIDSRPLVGEAGGEDGKGLWVCAGFNGNGMALAFQSAQALVDMITTGKEPEYFPRGFRFSRVKG